MFVGIGQCALSYGYPLPMPRMRWTDLVEFDVESPRSQQHLLLVAKKMPRLVSAMIALSRHFTMSAPVLKRMTQNMTVDAKSCDHAIKLLDSKSKQKKKPYASCIAYLSEP